MDWSGLLWCFYQMFGLSIWRHPFTAEHPLLSKWCKTTFLQICSHEETNSSKSWMTRGWVYFSAHFLFRVKYYFNKWQEVDQKTQSSRLILELDHVTQTHTQLKQIQRWHDYQRNKWTRTAKNSSQISPQHTTLPKPHIKCKKIAQRTRTDGHGDFNN